ncbi:MAG: type II toxin-antitoxin system RelE/ParE family toxin [Emticicia sp.]|nr:type II toxin-antitoxin system RelE/ParE family toxin [Emticicia sp.]
MTGVDTITNPKSIGINDTTAYRIRVEDYRATYTIEDDIITIFIFEIEHRSKVYKKS